MRKFAILAVALTGLSACAQTGNPSTDRALTGAALGGATGAVVGGVATGRASGALAGGAIGAAGGAIIGSATAPQQQRCYRDVYGQRYCEAY